MNTQEQFEQLKQRFQPALSVLDGEEAAIQLMNIQDGRLAVRASVKGAAERDRIMEAFRQIDPSLREVHADIRVEGEENVPVTGQTTVQTSGSFSQEGGVPSNGE